MSMSYEPKGIPNSGHLAQIHEAARTGWQGVGVSIARVVVGAIWIGGIAYAIQKASALGFSEQQVHWLIIFPGGLIAFGILAPVKFMSAVREIRTVILGDVIQFVGRVAFWGGVAMSMGYCGLTALQDAKWLAPENLEFIRLVKPDVRLAFLACIIALSFYRIPMLKNFDAFAEWVMGQMIWLIANLVASGCLFAFYGHIFSTLPTDLDSIPVMIAAAMLILLLMLVVAGNHEYARNHVFWHWVVNAPPPVTGQNLAPPRPTPHVLT